MPVVSVSVMNISCTLHQITEPMNKKRRKHGREASRNKRRFTYEEKENYPKKRKVPCRPASKNEELAMNFKGTNTQNHRMNFYGNQTSSNRKNENVFGQCQAANESDKMVQSSCTNLPQQTFWTRSGFDQNNNEIFQNNLNDNLLEKTYSYRSNFNQNGIVDYLQHQQNASLAESYCYGSHLNENELNENVQNDLNETMPSTNEQFGTDTGIFSNRSSYMTATDNMQQISAHLTANEQPLASFNNNHYHLPLPYVVPLHVPVHQLFYVQYDFWQNVHYYQNFQVMNNLPGAYYMFYAVPTVLLSSPLTNNNYEDIYSIPQRQAQHDEYLTQNPNHITNLLPEENHPVSDQQQEPLCASTPCYYFGTFQNQVEPHSLPCGNDNNNGENPMMAYCEDCSESELNIDDLYLISDEPLELLDLYKNPCFNKTNGSNVSLVN